MKKALSYLLIFIGLQIVGGGIITILWNVIAGNSDETAAKLITTTAVVGIITIVIFLWTRYAEVSPKWLRTRPWTVLTWSVVAAMGAIIPSMWIQEQMPELPNFAEQAFDTILGTPWGYFVIGLLAPLSEEIVMRGAILKELLKSEKLPVWASITISAVMHLCSDVLRDTHEPRADAPRISYRTLVRLDVLAHRLYPARRCLPLGQQQHCLCDVRILSRSRHETH